MKLRKLVHDTTSMINKPIEKTIIIHSTRSSLNKSQKLKPTIVKLSQEKYVFFGVKEADDQNQKQWLIVFLTTLWLYWNLAEIEIR